MTEENSGNLPILDDIIKSGDADKAAPGPDVKVRNSALATGETVEPASMKVFAKTGTSGYVGNDTVDLTGNGSEPGGDKLPDIDALTEEILFSMLPELEHTLRVKIRQALSRHFDGASDTD